ncbi:hypothetical protein L873DRAFT_1844980 [Choiromyces venosus 120613-1]|uniref:Uncharacterized protein n=1 Tax=Choiromyces venosus 120613-1 TaxID=1336337 RepID=A0A3N4JUA1_9PEZI|nr:hypothetical protein L873DRAFT_1844980 [Choiromyces venosus 120613-1]
MPSDSDSTINANRQRQIDELVLISSMFPTESHWEKLTTEANTRNVRYMQASKPPALFISPYRVRYPPTSPTRAIPPMRGGGQENIDILITAVTEIFTSLPSLNASSPTTKFKHTDTPLVIVRTLLWFHHLLSTQKRKCIATWGRELGMSGYSRPGYPGAVFVEGEKGNVEEFVSRLKVSLPPSYDLLANGSKGLKWQAIQVRDECQVASGQRVLPREAGVVEVEGLGDVAERLRGVGGRGLEEWFFGGDED